MLRISMLSLSPPGECQESASNYAIAASLKSVPIHYSLPSYHLTWLLPIWKGKGRWQLSNGGWVLIWCCFLKLVDQMTMNS
jgi:hypothetical protein